MVGSVLVSVDMHLNVNSFIKYQVKSIHSAVQILCVLAYFCLFVPPITERILKPVIMNFVINY